MGKCRFAGALRAGATSRASSNSCVGNRGLGVAHDPGHVSNSDAANWFRVEPMKVVELRVLTARIGDQIPPGSPDRTRLELRVPSVDNGGGNQPMDPMD